MITILCSGSRGDIQGLPENVIAIGAIPHTWLFPRCAAVCHHGGAGTEALSLAVTQSAATLGEKISDEDGAKRCAEMISKLI